LDFFNAETPNEGRKIVELLFGVDVREVEQTCMICRWNERPEVMNGPEKNKRAIRYA
jgi:hypothetical protein